MVRPYAMKGFKRKGNEISDRGEEAQPLKKSVPPTCLQEDHEVENSAGIPGIPNFPCDKDVTSGAIFILEKASLEVAKVGKTYQILNSEDHANFLRKNNKNPADYRPDIVHQALLAILDSPLNKAGRVKTIYVRTQKGVLFEIKPYVRLPRTYKRFSGIMLQLLQKLSISASEKREKLLRVVKNPVTQYLPVGCRKIGFSYSSEKAVEMHTYLDSLKDDVSLVFVVGAMAHGKIDREYTDDYLAISGYQLSAAWCISTICGALQNNWKIF